MSNLFTTARKPRPRWADRRLRAYDLSFAVLVACALSLNLATARTVTIARCLYAARMDAERMTPYWADHPKNAPQWASLAAWTNWRARTTYQKGANPPAQYD